MLPDLRIVIAALISTFLLTLGIGFYASSRLAHDQIASMEPHRSRVNWPKPDQMPETALPQMAAPEITGTIAADHQTQNTNQDANIPAEASPPQKTSAPRKKRPRKTASQSAERPQEKQFDLFEFLRNSRASTSRP